VGADFCPEMVRLGEGKRRRAESGRGAGGRVRLGVADALRLPFAEASFDAVTVAFGIRNVCDLQAGLVEMLRVLKPGGLAVVLEFTTPARAWFRALFGLYFHRLLPRIGRLLAPSSGPGRGSAYRYLPDSVAVFPGAEGLAEEMTRAGFSAVRYRRLSLGIAALHAGRRPPAAAGGAEP
jgi:demethylmenaquinone methyltransferase/2-methoxy-6-polyprenyl-1,4-benzoquinol methylase